MRSLGKNQLEVLRHLQQSKWKEWWPHVGWYWDTVSGTEKIMESLEKRGFVKKLPTGAKNKVASYKYVLTKAGEGVELD